ncbi:MAG: DUF3892 domain-containing protein [Candidatus Sabulitectum sp.]|nr:DUF3892 domain-containing protein [Candidatus Sabulitectum sp.]
MTKKRIVDVRNDEKGNISHVKFDGNSRFTPVDQAVRIADKDQIENVHSVHPTDGRSPYIRSNPDGKTTNNLDTMEES